MEPDAALVGADGIVVLHAVAHVGAHAACIVHPRHAECVDSVGDAEAFQQVDAFEVGVTAVDVGYGVYNLFHRLQIFRLVGKPCPQILNKFFFVHVLF